jgi:hypothetical protein
MSNVLTSWKEIAQYLGKGVRTVQRWEQLYGLPVRRPQEQNHHAILAIPEELDAWLRSQHTSSHSELETLRREVKALRTENALLKEDLARTTSPHGNGNGFHFDPDLILRTRSLILETAQLRELTVQLVARARILRTDLTAVSSLLHYAGPVDSAGTTSTQ